MIHFLLLFQEIYMIVHVPPLLPLAHSNMVKFPLFLPCLLSTLQLSLNYEVPHSFELSILEEKQVCDARNILHLGVG